jgi:pilin isopeptide linkage protein
VKISKFSKTILAFLLAISLVLAMAPLTVFAEGNQVELEELPVELKITGDTPSTDATFTFELTPQDTNANTPMPVVSQDSSNTEASSATATITGAGKVSFGTIYYPAYYGNYYYVVKQTTANISRYTLDSSVYIVHVEVKKDSDGVWQTEVTARKESSNVKEDLVFTNKYTVPSPYVTPTPTPSESEPESSTPSEPDEDTDSKTETPGNTTPENPDSSDTESTDSESPSKSDNRHNNGTSENPDSDEPNGSTPTTDEQPDTDTATVPTAVPASVANPVTGNSTTPKTGDSSQVILWAAVAVGSGIILFFGFFLILKKRK